MALESVVTFQDVPGIYAELLNPAHYAFNSLALWNFAAALISGLAGYLTLRWEHRSRASRLFATFAVLFLLWSAGRGFMRGLVEPELVLFLARRVHVLIVFGVIVVYHFATVMLRTERRRRQFLELNWLIAAAIAFLSFTTESVLSGVVEYSWGYEPIYGPLGHFAVAWISLLIVMASVDAYRAWRASVPGTRERRRIASFITALLVLYTGFIEFLPTMGFAVYPLAFAPITLFIVITGYLTYRFGLVEFTPTLVAKQLAEMMRGALLILDPEGIIQYANRRCQAVFGLPNGHLLGHRARRVFGDAFDPDALGTLARTEDRELELEWTHANPQTGKSQELALSVIDVQDRRQRGVATVCVVRDVTARKRALRERESANLHDQLTELPNRAMFVGLLDATVQRAREAPAYSYAVCFVGMDRMRIINEDLGTGAGDRVLAEVSARLRRAARPQDTVARVGGDEFGVLLRGHAGGDEVRAMAKRFLEAVRVPLTMEDHELFLSASAGVVVGDSAPTNGAELLRRASMAMYHAKEAGGGGLELATVPSTVSQRTRLESDLRRAIENDELRVHYQPIVDLKEQRVTGFEALVRWDHPKRGLLLPSEFIEFAEEAGLLGAIDHVVLGKACHDLHEMQQALGDPRLSVSVNLGQDEIQSPNLADRVRDRLLQSGLNPECLRIELLERVALIDPLRATLDRLRAMGVGLYVDDFGTGYSALSRLHDLPVTAVKIDREFIRGLSLGPGGEKTIRGILALARSLGLGAIAEGCSTATDVQRLYEMGCRQVQGFYFSKALPLEAAVQLAGDPELLSRQFNRLGLSPPASRNLTVPR